MSVISHKLLLPASARADAGYEKLAAERLS